MAENTDGVSGHEFAGKRALVTGGSRGIGAAIARQFLDAGAKVLTTARSEPSDTPSGVSFVKADLRTRAGVDALARAVLAELGGVDILVNNAGAGRVYGEGSSSIPDDEWQDALDINYLSSVRLSTALLPQMRERRSGAIVNISSTVVFAPGGAFLHYAAAKSALETYSRGLAIEVAPDGIRVNTVTPGNIATPGGDLVREQFAAAGAGQPKETGTDVPLGRMGAPDDIANVVTFLVSDRASWITGREFVVDGGQFPRG
jgi:NAD(P)-dependent dehydrogenase (short-subunit alcohol dehydrogenase family)